MAEGFTCAVAKFDRRYLSACKDLPQYKDTGYCVLHFLGEGKSEDFEKVKKSKLADPEKNYDFGGTFFPEGTSNFEGVEFDANANFAGATFFGDANFYGAQFSGDTSFMYTRFSGDTSFMYTRFSGERTDFREAKFSGEGTDFSEAQFRNEGGTLFSGAQFSGERTSFNVAKFHGSVTDFTVAQFSSELISFSRASFSGQWTSFNGAQFRNEGGASFSRAYFSSERIFFSRAQFSGERTDFREAKFNGERIDFSGAQFSGERTDFRGAKFLSSKAGTLRQETLFSGAYFSDDTDFSRVFFLDETHFQGARFSGYADFLGAQFNGDADFRGARFSGERTSFSGAHFSRGETSFYGAYFGGERTSFYGTYFNGETTVFREAQFSGPQDFLPAHFGGFQAKVDFSYAAFDKSVRLSAKAAMLAGPLPRSAGELPEVQFTLNGISIGQPDASLFHSVSLRPSWLVNVVDVHKLRLINVHWSDVALETELQMLAETDAPHELLARTCRELAANAEENRDYPLANHFYYWSMEALRKAGRRKLGLIRTMYWALSGYGVRAGRAFLVLLGIWAAFTILYILVPSSPFSGFSVSDFGKAIVYSLGAIARLNPQPRPSPGLFQFLVTVEGLVGPLQIGLLLLAIRRQVMR